MTSAATDFDALTPHAVDAEQALIGAILHHPNALDGVRHILEPSDFYEKVHGALYEAMCQRRDAGEHIDQTLVRIAAGNGDLGGISVGQYLANVVGSATTISGAPGYARMIRSAARMRVVLHSAQSAVTAMTDGAVRDPAEFASQMIEELDSVVSSSVPENLRRIRLGDSVASVIERVNDARAGRVRRGAPYGLPLLDKTTLGMREDQLIILAGRPGMGKTTVGIHIALAAAKAGFGVGFVSLEMNAGELAERALSAVVYNPRERDYLTYRDIAEGTKVSDEGFWRLQDGKTLCDGLPLEIEQQPGLTIAQIATRARQLKIRFERAGTFLGVLIIDHIGLIRPSKRYAGNRVQEMTEISSALKGMAKELGVPILALSQLNRGVEQRPDKRPLLSDLRDSGSIEQDADVVIGLFREAYYLEHKTDLSIEDADRLSRVKDTLEIEILKQRGGPTTRIECFCDIACNVLAEMSR